MSATAPAFLPYLARQLAGAVLLGLLLALIGPFGTFRELSTGERFTYWLVIAVLNWLQIVGTAELLTRWPRTAPLNAFVLGALAGLIAAVPASFEVAWLEQYFRPGSVAPQDLPVLYLQVAALSSAIAGPLAMLKRRQHNIDTAAADAAPAATAAEQSEPAAPRSSSFLRRVPPSLGSNLLALEMEDHYLRIHTDRGSDLILCRFADALAELDDAAGLRVHRSWWVARAAVDSVRRREDGKLTLQLSNGLTVPVSRSYDKALREAGWMTAPGRDAMPSAAESRN